MIPLLHLRLRPIEYIILLFITFFRSSYLTSHDPRMSIHKGVKPETPVPRNSSVEDEKVQYNEDGDSIIAGSEGVTQRDLDTYRHTADHLPLAAWLVVIVEFAERYVVRSSALSVWYDILRLDGHIMGPRMCLTTTFVHLFLRVRPPVQSLLPTV